MKVNSFPSKQILLKLKTFVEDKVNLTQTLKFVYRSAENIVKKGKITFYQHFPDVFKRLFLQGPWKSGLFNKDLTNNLAYQKFCYFPYFD